MPPAPLKLQSQQFFLPHSYSMLSLEVNLFKFLDDPYNKKTRVMGPSGSEDFNVTTLHHFVTTATCDGQTARQTDRHLDEYNSAHIACYANVLLTMNNTCT